MNPVITVIGGGLAGAEAAWQIARGGCRVRLFEMRPGVTTPAHATGLLGELVCSNSLKSNMAGTAPFLLKEELRRLDSLLLRIADEVKVPAGHALAVDREQFARRVTEEIANLPQVEIVRQEVREIPSDGTVIVASGPLTSGPLAESVARFTGTGNLYFYDAISPIVDADTLDRSRLSAASRYGKGGEDYLNAFLSEEEYAAFYKALTGAESAPLHSFEKELYFEGCLPLEELARRGFDTLRFGPMKPVGLVDPRTGKRAYAAAQLRLENLMADSYSLVGFQNHMTFSEQQRVFRLIPGLENAGFTRYGRIHRNSYINAPAVVTATLQTKKRPELFFAGQICGVEGYVESIATGLLAGVNAARIARGRKAATPPRETACGSLAHFLVRADPDEFQPANMSFGLLPEPSAELRKIRNRRQRRDAQVRLALDSMDRWKAEELREQN
ncbi:MAG TPA: methylenetetrahydrofolate--tRNA-(uracil(54)-C(5))-methyltransferase (FADH(2)-oxidizing) TrmFO [Acidobacteriota bacterium]|nr:methylenetetrahydrofolate--tRNA-(uracil(54)-C(5))-methyltransferase (FADH(2)-oxidizing) TrmFO [Acidobacteriota bacterium]